MPCYLSILKILFHKEVQIDGYFVKSAIIFFFPAASSLLAIIWSYLFFPCILLWQAKFQTSGIVKYQLFAKTYDM